MRERGIEVRGVREEAATKLHDDLDGRFHEELPHEDDPTKDPGDDKNKEGPLPQ